VTEVYYKKDEYDNVFIHCPQCRTEQELPINDEWYTVEINGVVAPVFVCMEPQRKCDCMLDIKLKDWKG